jgi:hypothetical protein
MGLGSGGDDHSFEGECWRCQLVNLTINGSLTAFSG